MCVCIYACVYCIVDINECLLDVCKPSEICLNKKGSYACFTQTCEPGFDNVDGRCVGESSVAKQIKPCSNYIKLFCTLELARFLNTYQKNSTWDRDMSWLFMNCFV